MATLSPPQPNRARSSSIVQPLTIDSTLRRTPAVSQCPLPADAVAPPTPITPSNCTDLPPLGQSPSLSQLVTLSLNMLPTPRPSPKHEIDQLLTPPYSSESSPRPSFSSVFTRPPPQSLPTPALSPRSLSGFPFPAGRSVPRRTYYAPLVLLTTVFVLSFIPIIFAVSTLPITSLKSVPRTVADIAALGKELQAYSSGSSAGMAHVMGVMCCLAIWKHAWSIPGSVVLNVLTGALLSPLWATLLMTLLTTTGSLVATLLAAPLSPLVQRFVPKALDVVSVALQGAGRSRSRSNAHQESKRTPTWVRLVVMRLVGVVPWSGINIACGVCRVSFVDCAIGAFIGTLPWTAVTCQIGDILQTLAVSSTSADPKTLSSLLSSPSIIFKLVLLSLLSLGPVLYRNKLTALLGGSTVEQTLTEKPVPVSPRWRVWQWRRNSNEPARPRSPERRLEEDFNEKSIDRS